MENNELLQAMQAMMKEEISGLRQEMTANNASLRQELGQMMDEKLAANTRELKQEINGVDMKLEVTKRELKESINGVDMKLDRHFQQIQNLLKEDYSPIAETARETKEKVSDYDEVKSTQTDHARAIQTHNERITALEEKAI